MLDFRPDLDPRTPGLVTAIGEMIPTARGYRSALAEVDAGPPFTYTLDAGEVYPNVCFATRWNSAPGGIVIAGTNKKLNVLNITSGYIDVSKAGGYAIGGLPFQWAEDAYGAFDLCAFGDIVIACNKSAPSQKRSALDLTGATLFSDLGVATAAPVGSTCCVSSNFVFIGDVGNWSTVTGAADILAWSAIGDHTDWRVNPQVTQCSFAQFVDTPGAITCVRPFKDGIVVFKANSMYRGRYVGAGPNSPIWDFERISDKVGCVGHRSITNTDHALVFVGRTDVYIYDGTQPASITQGIHGFLIYNDLFIGSGRIPMQVAHDRLNDCVWLSSNTMTIVWNYRLNKWGMLSTQQTAQPICCQTNIDDLRTVTVSGITAGVPTLTESYDWINLYTLRLFAGVTKNRNTTTIARHFLTTGWFGQPDKLQTIQRVNPIFTLPPATVGDVQVTVYGSKLPYAGTTLGAPPGGTALGTALMNSSYRCDLLGPTPSGTIAGSTQNFLAIRYDFTNAAYTSYVEIVDLVPKLVAAGER